MHTPRHCLIHGAREQQVQVRAVEEPGPGGADVDHHGGLCSTLLPGSGGLFLQEGVEHLVECRRVIQVRDMPGGRYLDPLTVGDLSVT